MQNVLIKFRAIQMHVFFSAYHSNLFQSQNVSVIVIAPLGLKNLVIRPIFEV